jgi:hypothetical protein
MLELQSRTIVCYQWPDRRPFRTPIINLEPRHLLRHECLKVIVGRAAHDFRVIVRHIAYLTTDSSQNAESLIIQRGVLSLHDQQIVQEETHS